MKKLVLLLSLIVVACLSLFACGETVEEHIYEKHEAVAATCQTDGNLVYYTCSHCDKIFDENQVEIAAIPTTPKCGHTYILHSQEVAATCSTKGQTAHYTCSTCTLKFDLSKQVIDSVEVDYDYSCHSQSPSLTVVSQPTKTVYSANETFDFAGMQVLYGCADCSGEILDNQFLTVTYQTLGATAFTLGDQKVSVCYGETVVDIPVTVSKKQAVISGVEESYQTVCGVAPTITYSVNYSDLEVVIEYYCGDEKVEPSSLQAGGDYTVKVFVESTDAVDGCQAVATVSVSHERVWRTSEGDLNKLEHACACGDSSGAYALDNQIAWVDDRDISFDFASLVGGANSVSVDSVKKFNGDNLVDITPAAVNGSVYTFVKSDFAITEWTPYDLPLSVTLTVDGAPLTLRVHGKFVERVIKTADDLSYLVYTGEKLTGYFVLANDIDASDFVVNSAIHSWVADAGFQGVLNGQGYTIKNLHATGAFGLFGAIGDGAKILDVNFTAVKADVEYALAFAIRNAVISNLNFEFAKDSKILKIAYTINDCTIENFTVKTCIEEKPFLIDENPSSEIPDSITIDYYDYHSVSFNSNGGTQFDNSLVTDGRVLNSPAIPEKGNDGDIYYEFAGWYIGEDKYDFTAPVVEDLVLEARWTEVKVGPYGKPVLSAANQTLTRWDYGDQITVTNSTDSFYGDIMVMSVSGCKEQGFTHTAINTGDYEKIYFFVFNPCDKDIRFNAHGAKTWAAVSVMIPAKAWTRIEIPAALFNEEDRGWVGFTVQDPDAISVKGEWKITSFFGLKQGEQVPEIINPILVDASCQTLTKWDYGKEITVVNSKDEVYGDIFVVTVDEVGEQSITHTAVSTTGFEKVSFSVYNPCSNKVRLTIHGGYGDGWGYKVVEVECSAWTTIEVSVEAFELAVKGQIFIMIQDPDAVSVAGEWKFTSFYGVAANENA